eukprot:s2565_g6.t1
MWLIKQLLTRGPPGTTSGCAHVDLFGDRVPKNLIVSFSLSKQPHKLTISLLAIHPYPISPILVLPIPQSCRCCIVYQLASKILASRRREDIAFVYSFWSLGQPPMPCDPMACRGTVARGLPGGAWGGTAWENLRQPCPSTSHGYRMEDETQNKGRALRLHPTQRTVVAVDRFFGQADEGSNTLCRSVNASQIHLARLDVPSG